MVVGRRDVHEVNCKFEVFCVFRLRGKGVDAAPVLGWLCLILFGPP
jgi:hypothetical protein